MSFKRESKNPHKREQTTEDQNRDIFEENQINDKKFQSFTKPVYLQDKKVLIDMITKSIKEIYGQDNWIKFKDYESVIGFIKYE